MSTLEEAVEAEQEALRDAATAETIATQLEQRLEGGDDTVTPDELDNAHRIAKWARSHAKGVSARRAKAAADDAIAKAKAAIDDAADVGDLDAELVERWRETVAAVSALVEVTQRRTTTVWANHNTLSEHRSKVARVADVDLAQLGALPGREVGSGLAGYRIPARGIDIADVRPADVLAEAISVGNAGRLHLGDMTLSNRHPLAGSSLAAKVTGWNAAAKEVQP